MVRLMKKISKKAGLPPGTLVHVGEKKIEDVQIRLVYYEGDHIEERELDSIEECYGYEEKAGVTWINIDGIHRVDVIEELGAHYRLHPLTLEDVVNTDQRPKVEEFPEYILFVLKTLSYDSSAGELKVESVSLILGPNYVISFQEAAGDVFNPVKARIRKEKGRLRRMGPDYLVYALIDAIVDNYFIVLENMGEEIESLEEELVADPGPATLNKIHYLKRKLISLRRSVWPLREAFSTLERGESDLVQDKTLVFLRDVYDHTIQIIDTIETCRDMVSSMLDIYLSSISNRMNEVMKVLTIFGTIFLPLTFITGIYGMNFKFMPELKWHWGYLFVWVTIIVIGAAMMLFFRRKKWI